jgi:hypothetical protein
MEENFGHGKANRANLRDYQDKQSIPKFNRAIAVESKRGIDQIRGLTRIRSAVAPAFIQVCWLPIFRLDQRCG